MARIREKIKVDRLFTTPSGSLAAKAGMEKQQKHSTTAAHRRKSRAALFCRGAKRLRAYRSFWDFSSKQNDSEFSSEAFLQLNVYFY